MYVELSSLIDFLRSFDAYKHDILYRFHHHFGDKSTRCSHSATYETQKSIYRVYDFQSQLYNTVAWWINLHTLTKCPTSSTLSSATFKNGPSTRLY